MPLTNIVDSVPESLASPLSRRTVVAAGLWSVPVMAVSSAVPAFATASNAAQTTLSTPSGFLTASGANTLTVTVRTPAGAPSAGQAVSLTAPAGATLGATDGTTGSNGTFSTSIDLGTPWVKPGTSVTISAVAGGDAVSQPFTVVGANLAVGGNNATGQLGLGATSDPVTTVRQTAQVFPAPVIDVRASGFQPGGGLFALALLADGSVWSVGANGYGQLGDGTTTSRASWAKVSGLPAITSIAALRGNAYAVDANGDLWSWGEAQYGQLGEAVASNRAAPAKVSTLAGVKLIRGGNSARLVQKTDGTWWGFGWNGTGLLATGDTTNQSNPVRIAALDGFTDVSDGFGYGFLGLKGDGTVWAWGSNKIGQLCDGTTTNSSTPKQIAGLSGAVAVAAAQGADYEQATAYVLKSDGTVWGWGRNDGEQVNSSKSDLTSPVQVTSGAAQIVGSQNNVFVLKTDGSVWTRGAQLDYRAAATSGTVLTMPRSIGALRAATTAFGATALYAIAVEQVATVDVADAKVSAGSASTVTVTVKAGAKGVPGVAVSLTATANAALGAASGTTDGNGVFSTTVTPDSWTKAGTGVTVAAATDSGQATDSFVVLGSNLMVAGANSAGQLAIGAASDPVSALRQSATTLPLPVKAIAASGYGPGAPFTLALLTDGSVWSVGGNNYGQLGDGTTTSRTAWAQVQGLPAISSISVGGTRSYAVTAAGDLWSWGEAGNSGLGEPVTSDRLSPARVSSISGVKAVYTPVPASALALKSDGTWWGWGRNTRGQLADGTTTSQATPVRITALDGFTDVTSGFGYGFVGLKSDGTVWAWGGNGHGQLCDGTTTDSSTPKQIPGLTGVVQIVAAMGAGYTDASAWALRSDGTVWGWGKNNWKQIDDSANDITTPIQLTADAVQIASSQGAPFVLKNDGTLWTRGLQLDWRKGGASASTIPLPRTAASITGAVINSTSIFVLAADEKVSIDIPATTVNAGVYTPVTTKVMAGSTAVAGAAVTLSSPNLADFDPASGTTAADGTFSTSVAPDPWTAPGTMMRVTAASGPSAAIDTFRVFGANAYRIGFGGGDLSQIQGFYPSPISKIAYANGSPVVLLADGTVWTGDADGRMAQATGLPKAVGVSVSGVGGSVGVLDETGDVWVWGNNAHGQLGNGTTYDATTPQKVSNLSNIKQVAVGRQVIFALKTDGTVWASGWNSQNQLGDTGPDRSTFAQIPNLTGVKQISSSMTMGGLALKIDGTVWAWGSNSSGQLTTGDTTDSATPVQISGLTDITSVSGGSSRQSYASAYGLALKSDGSLWAWGCNDDGQLGDGTTANKATPVKFADAIVDMTGGGGAVYALKSDRSTLLVSGYNKVSSVGNTTTPKPVTIPRPVLALGSQQHTAYDNQQVFLVIDPFRPSARTAPNLASFAPVKASYEHPSYKAPNAVDGNGSTRWVGAASDPNWLVVDLGAEHGVNRVELSWEVQSAVDFTLGLSSDSAAWTDPANATWNTVYTKTGATPGARNDSVTFATARGRYLRLYISKRSYTYGPGLYEIRAYRD